MSGTQPSGGALTDAAIKAAATALYSCGVTVPDGISYADVVRDVVLAARAAQRDPQPSEAEVLTNGEVWAQHGHPGLPCSPPEAVRATTTTPCRLAAQPSPPVHTAVEAVPEQLAAALRDALFRMTPHGETDDGDIAYYLVTKGTVHRLVAAAQSAGTGAALRSGWVPEPAEAGAIERVARAIHASLGSTSSGWTDWIPQAKATLAALAQDREATP